MKITIDTDILEEKLEHHDVIAFSSNTEPVLKIRKLIDLIKELGTPEEIAAVSGEKYMPKTGDWVTYDYKGLVETFKCTEVRNNYAKTNTNSYWLDGCRPATDAEILAATPQPQPTTLIPFDLDKAKAGGKVVTRTDMAVECLTDLGKKDYNGHSLVGMVDRSVYLWSDNGRISLSGQDEALDLFMQPDVKVKQPIQFLWCLDMNSDEPKIVRASMNPYEFKEVRLLSEKREDNKWYVAREYDTMYAIGEMGEHHGTIYIGHYNDGTL